LPDLIRKDCLAFKLFRWLMELDHACTSALCDSSGRSRTHIFKMFFFYDKNKKRLYDQSQSKLSSFLSKGGRNILFSWEADSQFCSTSWLLPSLTKIFWNLFRLPSTAKLASGARPLWSSPTRRSRWVSPWGRSGQKSWRSRSRMTRTSLPPVLDQWMSWGRNETTNHFITSFFFPKWSLR